MNSFRYKLIRFISGRYGVDSLFYLLFALAAFFAIVNVFLRSIYLQMAVYILVIIALLRMMSRNHTARRRENTAFLSFFNKAKAKKQNIERIKNDKTHVYKKCPYCKAMLRLPRIKGKHKTVCPRCNCEFSVRVYKN